MNTIVVTIGDIDYKFYGVSSKLAKAITLILHECENESNIVSAVFQKMEKMESEE